MQFTNHQVCGWESWLSRVSQDVENQMNKPKDSRMQREILHLGILFLYADSMKDAIVPKIFDDLQAKTIHDLGRLKKSTSTKINPVGAFSADALGYC